MPLTLVKGMELQPNCCTICGGNPVGDNGEQLETVFAEGVDIDWGNSLYICWDCANVIASLVGRVTREGFDDLERRHEALLEAHAELEEKSEKDEALLSRIRDGAKAAKEVKAGV